MDIHLGMPEQVEDLAHQEFRSVVLHPSFACVMAASAVRRGDYSFHSYARLGAAESAEKLAKETPGVVRVVNNLKVGSGR